MMGRRMRLFVFSLALLLVGARCNPLGMFLHMEHKATSRRCLEYHCPRKAFYIWFVIFCSLQGCQISYDVVNAGDFCVCRKQEIDLGDRDNDASDL